MSAVVDNVSTMDDATSADYASDPSLHSELPSEESSSLSLPLSSQLSSDSEDEKDFVSLTQPVMHASAPLPSTRASKPSIMANDKKGKRSRSPVDRPSGGDHYYAAKKVKGRSNKTMAVPIPDELQSWPRARQQAWLNVNQDPERYYYHWLKPHCTPGALPLNNLQLALFTRLLETHPHDDQWGVWAMANFECLTGRQCQEVAESLSGDGAVTVKANEVPMVILPAPARVPTKEKESAKKVITSTKRVIIKPKDKKEREMKPKVTEVEKSAVAAPTTAAIQMRAPSKTKLSTPVPAVTAKSAPRAAVPVATAAVQLRSPVLPSIVTNVFPIKNAIFVHDLSPADSESTVDEMEDEKVNDSIAQQCAHRVLDELDDAEVRFNSRSESAISIHIAAISEPVSLIVVDDYIEPVHPYSVDGLPPMDVDTTTFHQPLPHYTLGSNHSQQSSATDCGIAAADWRYESQCRRLHEFHANEGQRVQLQYSKHSVAIGDLGAVHRALYYTRGIDFVDYHPSSRVSSHLALNDLQTRYEADLRELAFEHRERTNAAMTAIFGY